MDLLNSNRKTLAIGRGATGGLAVVIALVAWPALTSPEPPLEKAGDGGLRIRLVEPPKAVVGTAGPLDVGLSEAAQAMVKGREALFPRAAPAPLPRSRPAPVQIAEADDTDDALPPPETVDDPWRREAARRDQIEQARRDLWEEEALRREARDERAAWEQERRRWEARRAREQEEDRYAPPPAEDGPPSARW